VTGGLNGESGCGWRSTSSKPDPLPGLVVIAFYYQSANHSIKVKSAQKLTHHKALSPLDLLIFEVKF